MNNAPNILSASTLTGDDIVNPQGENLGDLKDFMLDTTTGKIAYVVVAFGGVFGPKNGPRRLGNPRLGRLSGVFRRDETAL